MWEESLIFLLIYLGLFFMVPNKLKSGLFLVAGVVGFALGLYFIYVYTREKKKEKFLAGCGPNNTICGELPDNSTPSQWFHVTGYDKSFAQAHSVCARYGGVVATIEQVTDAYNNGASVCSAGFVADYTTKMYVTDSTKKVNVADPTTKVYFPSRGNCGTWANGVNTQDVGQSPPGWGVNCYGPRPPVGEAGIAPWTNTAGTANGSTYTAGEWSKKINNVPVPVATTSVTRSYCMINDIDLPTDDVDQRVTFNIYGRYVRVYPPAGKTIGLSQIGIYDVDGKNIAPDFSSKVTGGENANTLVTGIFTPICGPGSYSIGASASCQQCPAGTCSTGGAVETTTNNVVKTCELCPEGSSSGVGASSCTACPPNTFAPDKGSSLCMPCASSDEAAKATDKQARDAGEVAYQQALRGSATPRDRVATVAAAEVARKAAEKSVRDAAAAEPVFSFSSAGAKTCVKDRNPPANPAIVQPTSKVKIWNSSSFWEIDLGSRTMITTVRVVGQKGYGDTIDVAKNGEAASRIKGIRVVVLNSLTDTATKGTCSVAPTPTYPTGTNINEQPIIGPMILAGINGKIALDIYRELQKPTPSTDFVRLGLTDSNAAAAWTRIKQANLSVKKSAGVSISKQLVLDDGTCPKDYIKASQVLRDGSKSDFCYYCPPGTVVNRDFTYCNNTSQMTQDAYDQALIPLRSITNMTEVRNPGSGINMSADLVEFMKNSIKTIRTPINKTDGNPDVDNKNKVKYTETSDNGSRAAIYTIMGVGQEVTDRSAAYSEYTVANSEAGINAPTNTSSFSKNALEELGEVLQGKMVASTTSDALTQQNQKPIIVKPSTINSEVAVQIPALPEWKGAPRQSPEMRAATERASSSHTGSRGISGPVQSQWYHIWGYNKNRAQAIEACARYGGKLATIKQLQKAYDDGGSVCSAGHVEDSTTNTYVINRKSCGGFPRLGLNIQNINESPPGWAAHCFGPRPPIGEAGIAPWTDTPGLVANNVYTEGDWSRRVNGDGGILKANDGVTPIKPGTQLRSLEVFWTGIPGTNENFKSQADARAICVDAGGSLATLAQLVNAQSRGAHWEHFGWVNDNSEYQYRPSQIPTESSPPGSKTFVGRITNLVGALAILNSRVGIIDAANTAGITNQAFYTNMVFRDALSDGSAGALCIGIKPSQNPSTLQLDTGDISQNMEVNTRARFLRVRPRVAYDTTENTYLHFSQIAIRNSAGVNLALNKKTYATGSIGESGPPSVAVDGKLEPRYYGGRTGVWHSSTLATYSDDNTYWQVDLGSVQDISSISYYGRLGCCDGKDKVNGDRIIGTRFELSNYLSTVPFTSGLAHTYAWSQSSYKDANNCPPGTTSKVCISGKPASCIPTQIPCEQAGLCPKGTVYNTTFRACFAPGFLDGSGSWPGQGFPKGGPYIDYTGNCKTYDKNNNCTSETVVANFYGPRLGTESKVWTRWDGSPIGSDCENNAYCAPIPGSIAESAHKKSASEPLENVGFYYSLIPTDYHKITGYCLNKKCVDEATMIASSSSNASYVTENNKLAEKVLDPNKFGWTSYVNFGPKNYNPITNPNESNDCHIFIKCVKSTDPCFPGNAIVTMQTTNGSQKVPISELRIGDRILVAQPNGIPFFSDIVFFGHRDAETEAPYYNIKTADATLRVSGEHYVPVRTRAGYKYVTAENITLKDRIWVFTGGRLLCMPVLEITVENAIGIYNPFTLEGTLIADGALASSYSVSHIVPVESTLEMILPKSSIAEYAPAVWHSLFTPFRTLYLAMGPKWSQSWAKNAGEADDFKDLTFGKVITSALAARA